MDYCETCGAKLEKGQRFCPYCGKERSDAGEGKPMDYWAERLGHPQEEPEENMPLPEHEIPQPPEVPEPSAEEEPEDPGIPEEYLDILDPPRKERPRRLWILLGILAAAAAVGLALFFWLRNPIDSHTYYGKVCSQGENRYSADGDWVILRSNGRAEVCLLEEKYRGTWKVEDNRFRLECGNQHFSGKLSQGVLVLDRGDSHFVLAEAGIPWNEEKTDQVLKTPAHPAQWQQDYYGWWQVTQAWGGWEAYAGERYDACGRIFLETENTGCLELWDDQCQPGQLVCAADITIEQGLTEAGCLVSGEGRFLDLPLVPGDWNIDPGREAYKGLQDLLVLRGTLEDGSDGFSYLIVLRPWGLQWKDVDSLSSPLLPVSDRLPRGYRSWYLPIIGRKEPMPETMASGNP